jgi:Biotin/lipoate A/B protein ligase family
MSLGRSVAISDDLRLPSRIGPDAAPVIVIMVQKDESGSQMAPDSRIRVRPPLMGSLDLPPPFRGVALREAGDAFSHAVRVAAEAGAGTLVHVGRFDLAEFAVVLEPEEPLRTARRTLYAGLSALADALAAHAPPEKPINIVWPDAITVDTGLVGGGRLAWPAGADEDVPPSWLVFGAMIRTVAIGEHEPGLNPLTAALDDEGFVDLGSGRLVESFARHLMVAVDAWQQDGFAEVAKNYLSRIAPEKGLHRAIDLNGDLFEHRAGKDEIERRLLLPLLPQPSWLDRVTGGPRR